MKKIGRPSFKPTPALKQKVATAAGAGMSHEEIALALGIARNTLEKHFEHELSIGAYAKRMEVVQALLRAAKKGNVAAARLYMQLEPQIAAPPAHEGRTSKPAETAPAASPEKLGKKEQANADAVEAHLGTGWEGLLKPQSLQ